MWVHKSSSGSREVRSRKWGAVTGSVHRGMRWSLIPMSLLVSVLMLAVSGGGMVGAQTSPATSHLKPVTLTLGMGSVNVSYGPFWVAQAKGLFAKNGVKINVVSYNTAAQTAEMLASGEVDVELFSPALGWELLQKGIHIQYVYYMANFTSATNAIISSNSVTSVAQIKQMGTSCRFATTASASIPYVSAIAYSRLEGLKCQIVQFPTVPAELAAVVSGSAQLTSVPYTTALTAVDAGQARFLVDPLHMQKAVSKGLISAPYPVFVVMGQASLLHQNKTAVTRFIKAMREAANQMSKMSNAQLATMTAKLPAWSGTTLATLTQGWKAVRSQLSVGPKAGYISKAQWGAAQRGFTAWALTNYIPRSPLMTYKYAVNMTYWNAAS